jgi:hypothetical protein
MSFSAWGLPFHMNGNGLTEQWSWTRVLTTTAAEKATLMIGRLRAPGIRTGIRKKVRYGITSTK